MNAADAAFALTLGALALALGCSGESVGDTDSTTGGSSGQPASGASGAATPTMGGSAGSGGGALATGGTAGSGGATPLTGGAAGSGGSEPPAAGAPGTSGAAGSGTAGGAAIELPFAPDEGCADFSDPSCVTCCEAGVDFAGAPVCTERTASSAATLGPTCPADCPPCAVCTEPAADSLQAAADAPRPDCACDEIDIGVDPCFDPTGCPCHCSALEINLLSCPHLGPDVCSGGNQCGVILVVDPRRYAAGDQIRPVWINLSNQPVYLPGCTTYEIIDVAAGGTSLGPPAVCAWEGIGVKVLPGQSHFAMTLEIPASLAAGSYRLRGGYSRGCTDALPLSEAACTDGPILVESLQFGVVP